ncbi:MAG: TaqI-like C-terminal specificity domain-containing protein, partial [Patescibacteria group bacterium]
DTYEIGTTTADVYCYFYELSFNLLKERGVLSFITSNKWMRAKYGALLRLFVKEKTTILTLIDLGGGQFDMATVDTNVLIFSRKKPDEFYVFKYGNLIPKKESDLTNMNQNDLGNNSFTLMNNSEISLKNKISNIGTCLDQWGDININYGILTGKNEVKINNKKEGVFIINEDKRNELIEQDMSSKKILLPILLGKNIFRYGHFWDKKYLVAVNYNMHNKINNYPSIKVHLLKYEAILKQKSQVKRGDHHWIELDQNPSNRYIEEFKKDKIVWGNISAESEFCFNKGMAINAPANFITSDKVNLKYVLAVMNSKVFFWEFKLSGITLGEAFEWKIQYVRNIHVPKISSEQQKPFIKTVNQILKITTTENYDPKNPPIKQKELEKQIDEMVYKLYGLTEEEIKIVEDSNKK